MDDRTGTTAPETAIPELYGRQAMLVQPGSVMRWRTGPRSRWSNPHQVRREEIRDRRQIEAYGVNEI